MQSPVVMAFRKRLKKRGYTCVSIKKAADGPNYLVSSVEPLASVLVGAEYTLAGMYRAFRF